MSVQPDRHAVRRNVAIQCAGISRAGRCGKHPDSDGKSPADTNAHAVSDEYPYSKPYLYAVDYAISDLYAVNHAVSDAYTDLFADVDSDANTDRNAYSLDDAVPDYDSHRFGNGDEPT